MAEKKTSVNSIITSVEQVYAKLPSLPKNITEFIVMITPWLALIFGIFRNFKFAFRIWSFRSRFTFGSNGRWL